MTKAKTLLLSLSVVAITAFTPNLSPKQDKQLTFKFSIEQTNYILNSLSKQPYNEAAPIIQSIQVQAAPQLQDTIQTKKKQ